MFNLKHHILAKLLREQWVWKIIFSSTLPLLNDLSSVIVIHATVPCMLMETWHLLHISTHVFPDDAVSVSRWSQLASFQKAGCVVERLCCFFYANVTCVGEIKRAGSTTCLCYKWFHNIWAQTFVSRALVLFGLFGGTQSSCAWKVIVLPQNRWYPIVRRI